MSSRQPSRCTDCDAVLSGDAKFCAQCGTKVSQIPRPVVPRAANGKKADQPPGFPANGHHHSAHDSAAGPASAQLGIEMAQARPQESVYAHSGTGGSGGQSIPAQPARDEAADDGFSIDDMEALLQSADEATDSRGTEKPPAPSDAPVAGTPDPHQRAARSAEDGLEIAELTDLDGWLHTGGDAPPALDAGSRSRTLDESDFEISGATLKSASSAAQPQPPGHPNAHAQPAIRHGSGLPITAPGSAVVRPGPDQSDVVPVAAPLTTGAPPAQPPVQWSQQHASAPPIVGPANAAPAIAPTPTEGATAAPTSETAGAAVRHDSGSAVSSADASEQSAEDGSGSPPAQKQSRREYEQSRERLRSAVERGRHALFKLQDPIPQKSPRAVEKLATALYSTPADDQQKFIQQIERLGATQSPSAIEPLRECVTNRQREIRVASINSLARIPHASSSLILLGLLSERATEVADAAARGLIALRHEQSVPAVLAYGLTGARCKTVLFASIDALDDESRDQLQRALRRALESKDAEVAALALSLLSRLGASEYHKHFVKFTKHPAAVVRAAAVEALDGVDGKQAVRFINAAMTDPAAEVRAAAARGLKRLQSPRSMKLLSQALYDPEVSVRRAAARTLSEIGGEEATNALAGAIKVETDGEATLSMLEGLTKVASEEAFAALVRLLDSERPDVRHGAIAALRRLKNARAAPHLLRLVNSDTPETRRLAIEALGRLGVAKVAPRLRDRLKKDSHEDVRAAAARALGDLKDTESVMQLEESLHDERGVRCQAVIALGQIGKRTSAPALLVMLKDVAPEVRYHACNAVALIGEISNPEPLKALLDDNDAMVRRGAEAALNKLGVKISGQNWLRPLKRAVGKAASAVLPDFAAGGVPLAGIGIVAAAMLVISGLGYGIYAGLDSLGIGGGSRYSGPISYVISAAVSADGSHVAVLRNRGAVEAWRTDDGTMLNRFATPARTNSLLFGGDSKVLMFSTDGLLEWDPLTDPHGAALTNVPGDDVRTVQRIIRLPDGKTAYLFNGKRVAVLDLQTRQVQRNFELPVAAPGSIAVGPDQELMMYGDRKGVLHILSAKDGKEQAKLDATRALQLPATAAAQINDVAFSHDGKYMAIAFSTGHVQIWNVKEKTQNPLVKTLQESPPVASLAFHPSDLKLVLVNQKGVHVLSDQFEQRHSIAADEVGSPTRIQLSADGQTLVAFVDEVKDVWVFDLAGMKLKHQLKPDAK